MSPSRTEFVAGVRAQLPILVGLVPFAMISGVGAVNTGMTAGTAMAMSLIVFAGAAQLVALQLMASGAPALVVLLSTVVVNLRFMMYSASLAPYLRSLSGRWKGLLAYLLTDQAYALSIARYEQNDRSCCKQWYFLGAGLAAWGAWQAGTMAGVFIGTRAPAAWSLDFAIPLTFLALLLGAVKDQAAALSAAAAGVMATAASALPFNAGLMVAALTGIATGTLVSSRQK